MLQLSSDLPLTKESHLFFPAGSLDRSAAPASELKMTFLSAAKQQEFEAVSQSGYAALQDLAAPFVRFEALI
jgi:hypothetical protein